MSDDGRVQAAVRAVYVAFVGAGLAFASWASRIPQVRDELGLRPSELGLVLLAIAAGSIVALVSSGAMVARFGSRRTVAAMAGLLGVGMLVAAIGVTVGVPLLVAGLLLLGFGNGAWDVAMNVQGALVEHRLGRSIMSRFHAGFSLGTVAGALLGTLMVALGVSVTAHLVGIALVVPVVVAIGVQGFVRDVGEPATGEQAVAGAPAMRTVDAWREPRTLLVGVFVLAFAFAEGTGNDWISVAVIDGHGAPEALGTLGFAAFLAAMTAGRWVGPGMLDRHGRVAVVRACALLAVAGVLLFVLGPGLPAAFGGALLWGAGVSLGFPVGMSAGADDPRHAAPRVSVIASIGYCAFLGGPPLVGFLGDRTTVLDALLPVAVLLGLAALIAATVREPGTASVQRQDGAPARETADARAASTGTP